MKKISILALHLGFGGVEQAIINQANMFCEDYNVTLVVTYKLVEKPAFDVDPRIKIIYLTNIIPNKNEFKQALKTFKIFKVFKEGLKGIKGLYLKFYTMKKYIVNSEDDIIISSRISITKILNKYGRAKIKIAEEHRHHNNNSKYINSLVRACKNIDYLVCVSKELTDDYSKVMKNTKCVYIPNSLSSMPEKISKLNNKKLLSVGRISPEKGQMDLVDVFKIINDIDSEYTLDIVGAGVGFDDLKEKIDTLGLSKKIILHGFQRKDYIDKLYEKSSIFLMCSFEESFGIVLIEAGSYGLPQIAFSSAQGAKEIIINNKSGFLISNRDKKKMAKKTIELYNNRKKLMEFGLEARTISESFSFDAIKEKWLAFLKNI